MRAETLSKQTIHTVLAVVLILSIITWLISKVSLAGNSHAEAMGHTIMFLAYAKASLVIWHYMEIRWAPFWLKAACAAWVAISFLLVTGLSTFLA